LSEFLAAQHGQNNNLCAKLKATSVGRRAKLLSFWTFSQPLPAFPGVIHPIILTGSSATEPTGDLVSINTDPLSFSNPNSFTDHDK